MPFGALTIPRKMISVTCKQRLPPWHDVLKPSRTAVIGLTNGSRRLEAFCGAIPSAGAVATAGAGFGAGLTLATTGFAAGLGAAALAAGLATVGATLAAGLLTVAFGAAGFAAAVAPFFGGRLAGSAFARAPAR